MNNKYKNLSLSREYFYFASIVSIIIVCSLLWLLWFSYRNLEAETNRQYALEAERIQEVLEDSFVYTSNFIKFIGNKIIESGKYDAESTALILQNRVDVNKIKDDLFPWTMFEFVNSDNCAISSTAGVISPVKVDSQRRPWVITARIKPWALHLTGPDLGIVSGEYIIPGGYGITDKNNKFIGIISIGFSIAKLRQKIERSLRSDSSEFILLTEDLKLITSSTHAIHSLSNFTKLLKDSNFIKSNKQGKLDAEVTSNNIVYKYYKVMHPYKYIILIGQSKKFIQEEFKNLVLPQMVRTLITGISFLILLYFFRIKIVNPLILLSESARLLSRGNLNIKMPTVNSSEAAYLVEALEMVKAAFQRENLVRKQLFEANNKIKLSNADLEQKVAMRTKDLERALATKTEFLNNMSHEIRTPIQGLTGLSQSLVEHWKVLTEDKRFEISIHLANNSKRLLSLIGNLLDLSKFAAGKMLLTFQKTDFNLLVEDMIEECKILYVNKRKIKFEFKNNGSIFAYIDYERISQVLRNLFVNAIKFSRDNSVISISSNIINNTNDKGDIIKAIQFSISNEGVNIPEDEIKLIFDPFTQSTNTKTKAGGTGLGLAICREIIIGHYGKIWAENNASGGANFNFVIPIDQHNKFNASNNHKNQDKKIITRPANILIIDDENSSLLNMELFLYKTPYTLVKASGGAAGLQYLREYGQSIDLVLLDLMMPDIHGLDVLEYIRKSLYLAHLKVILQSGVADEKDISKAQSIGIDGYIKKPYQKSIVLSEISSVLSSTS